MRTHFDARRSLAYAPRPEQGERTYAEIWHSPSRAVLRFLSCGKTLSEPLVELPGAS